MVSIVIGRGVPSVSMVPSMTIRSGTYLSASIQMLIVCSVNSCCPSRLRVRSRFSATR